MIGTHVVLCWFGALGVFGGTTSRGDGPTVKSGTDNPAFVQAIDQFERDLFPAAQKVYRELMAETLELSRAAKLVSVWHGSDRSDGFRSFWTYKRSPDGTTVNRTIEIDDNEKTYARIVSRGLWFVKGKLIYEFDPTPGAEYPLSVLQIVSIDDQRLVNKFINEGELPDEWATVSEAPGIGEAPAPPPGYTVSK